MNGTGYWILRSGNQLFATGDADRIFQCGTSADFGNPRDALEVGEWLGLPCYAAEMDKLPDSLAGEWIPLRSLFNTAGAEAITLARRAVLLLDWQKNNRYCGRCGKPTVRRQDEFSMLCSACGMVAYPRISPAVMVLIGRGRELLLARSPRFKPGVYSALAGFVEAGETLEQCAIREVREEVGLEISNLRYFRSQSWPFPDSLMVAFFADYADGAIRPQAEEIEDARWFLPDALPPLPEPVSLARQLIDAARSRLDMGELGLY